MSSSSGSPIDLDVEFPDFPEAPERPPQPVSYRRWLEEIEPFRCYFEENFGESVPRRGGWTERFVL